MKTIEDVGVPRYLQFAQELREGIRNGNLKPGDRLPSFTEVRAEHGLSQATWDKVHSLLLSENLIVSQRGRGTFVAPQAMHAASGSEVEAKTSRQVVLPSHRRTGIIGVSGHGFGLSRNSIYWANVMDGIWAAAQRAGVQILLMNGDEPHGWDNADGVLLLDGSAVRTARKHRDRWEYVSVLEPFGDFPYVAADDYLGARMATEHLLGLGHRRIAYIHSNDEPVTGRRIIGYVDALRSYGVEPEARWRRTLTGANDSGQDFVRAGRACLQSWLEEDWRELGCTALLAQNDEVAIGCLDVFRAAEINVPDEVSVVGFDGATTDSAAEGLTTVEVPLREIGSFALEMLLRRIDTPAASLEQKMVPVDVRLGNSSAPPEHFDNQSGGHYEFGFTS